MNEKKYPERFEKIIKEVSEMNAFRSKCKQNKAEYLFSLKEYCLENMILLTKEQRETIIKEIGKRVKRINKNNYGTLEVRRLIGEVVDYLYDDEKRSFEESGKPKGHIFIAVKKLNDYLGIVRE